MNYVLEGALHLHYQKMWNVLHKVANLFIKEGSLFLLFATLRFPKPKSSPPTPLHALGMIEKLSMSRGAPRCFGKVHLYGMVQEYWTILSKKIQPNQNKCF